MFSNISIREIFILALIALVLFKGGEMLPNLVRGLGEAIREFRKSVKGK